MMDIVEHVDDYIAVYEDAPNWGGPTMYPAPLTIKQVKELRATIQSLRDQNADLERRLAVARADAVEECAKVADNEGYLNAEFTYDRARLHIAKAIRALSEPVERGE